MRRILFAAAMLIGSLGFSVRAHAQAICGNVGTMNGDAWAVQNCASFTETFVFATPNGTAFSPFPVTPGGTMPIFGNINQTPYRFWYCASPLTPIDISTGRIPTYNANEANIRCK
jgi:hypothetical protein